MVIRYYVLLFVYNSCFKFYMNMNMNMNNVVEKLHEAAFTLCLSHIQFISSPAYI